MPARKWSTTTNSPSSLHLWFVLRPENGRKQQAFLSRKLDGLAWDVSKKPPVGATLSDSTLYMYHRRPREPYCPDRPCLWVCSIAETGLSACCARNAGTFVGRCGRRNTNVNGKMTSQRRRRRALRRFLHEMDFSSPPAKKPQARYCDMPCMARVTRFANVSFPFGIAVNRERRRLPVHRAAGRYVQRAGAGARRISRGADRRRAGGLHYVFCVRPRDVFVGQRRANGALGGAVNMAVSCMLGLLAVWCGYRLAEYWFGVA